MGPGRRPTPPRGDDYVVPSGRDVVVRGRGPLATAIVSMSRAITGLRWIRRRASRLKAAKPSAIKAHTPTINHLKMVLLAADPERREHALD